MGTASRTCTFCDTPVPAEASFCPNCGAPTPTHHGHEDGEAFEPKLKATLADRYTVERELGRGGMATVYLAHDQKLGRAVALKVLSPELAASVGAERFLREIEIAAKLTHPNILALYDRGTAAPPDGGTAFLYYTMPYVEGESLRDRLNRERQLSIEDALQITKEVADALGYAHSLGIVHRDIKPENILFTAGHAAVSDFGIARVVTVAGAETLTETGLAIGTPLYMSPEQASGSKEVDARSDLYSLGCVLYEMLSGDAPYTASTPQAVIAKKLSEPTPRISVVRELVSGPIEAALTKALAKVPADRFATAQQFVEALSADQVSVTTPPATPKRRGLRGVVGAIAGIAIIAGAALAVWQYQRAAARPGPARENQPDAVLSGRSPTGTPAESLGVPPFTVVAEFGGSAEPEVRDAVHRLVRAALDRSGRVTSLPEEQVSRGLSYAGYADTARVTDGVARELALRASIPTVVSGTVDRIGRGYAVGLRLVEAEAQRVLASTGTEASSDDDLFGASDAAANELTADLSNQTGRLRQTLPTHLVATPSFEAYRKYNLARRLGGRDNLAARALLREALEIDPQFAMAWRELAITFAGLHDDSVVWATQEALKYRDRLSEAEQADLEALLAYVDGDWPAVIRLYDRIRLLDPSHRQGNRCWALGFMGRYAAANLCFDQELKRTPFGMHPQAILNGVGLRLNEGRLADARRLANELEESTHLRRRAELRLAEADADWARAESLANTYLTNSVSVVAAQQSLAKVFAARGAVRRADSILAGLGDPLARWTLGFTTGFEAYEAPTLPGESADPQLLALWHMAEAVKTRDAARARAALDEFRSAEVPNTRAATRRIQGEFVGLLSALLAYLTEDWEQVIVLSQARLAAWPDEWGEATRVPARWLLIAAHESLGQLDSAVTYSLQLAGPYPFAHFKLGQLYTQLSNREKAVDHFTTFLDTFTDPDPEYAWMVAEARVELQRLRRVG